MKYRSTGARKAALVHLMIVALLFLAMLGGLASPGTCAPENGTGVPGPKIFHQVSAKEAFDLIQRTKGNPNFVILDVRTPEEYAEGHIEGAVNMDYYHPGFQVELGRLDKTKVYLVYCRSGTRSEHTFQFMKEQQFKEVYEMKGGISSWREQRLPILK